MLKLTKNFEIPIVTLLLGILFIAVQLITGTNYPIFRDELVGLREGDINTK